MQKITFQKIFNTSSVKHHIDLELFHERCIARIVRQCINRRFKEEDYKDVNKIISLGSKSTYKVEYKGKLLGEVAQHQESNTIYLNFTPYEN